MKRPGPAFLGVRVVWVGLMVVVAALAGCSDDPAAGDVPPALEVADVDVDPRSRLGAISGVVVDEAIRPLQNATVMLVGRENVTTAADGTFSFQELDPGVHFISTKAAGFLPVQTSVEVAAGAAATVRILMQLDPTPQPYHQTIKYEGFIDSSAPLVSYSVNIVTADFLNMTTCECLWRFDSGNATTIVFEMVWESTSDPPTEPADMYYQMYEEGKSGITIQSEYVTSPYAVHVDREALWGNWTYFRVHFGGSSNWANVNQPFTAFVTFFYNGEALEGWSVVNGDT